MNQIERADLFQSFHVKGDPLILFNIWDAGSAAALQEAGAKAIATGSWSVAAAHGYQDGEKLPLELVLANLRRIVASVDLPVTLDFEGGYSASLAELQENIRRVVEAGAAGINFEDQVIGGQGLNSIEEQSRRVAAVREAAERTGVPLFINARTDLFLKNDPAAHNEEHLDEAIRRAHAYAKNGASGFFAPLLEKPEFIKILCVESPLPVNILMRPSAPTARELASLGVARISYGAGPYRQMMEGLKEASRKALE
jgi:2-methylisocitrate lyase-like PEP mutase family enzyme